MLDPKFYNKLKHTFHAQYTLHLPKIFNMIKKKPAKMPELRIFPDFLRYKKLSAFTLYIPCPDANQ